MSINLDQPLTCNGQPVEVLRPEWTKTDSGSEWTFVRYGGYIRVLASSGLIFEMHGTGHTATNTAPAPNLVGKNDVVEHKDYTSPLRVVEIRNGWIWGEWTEGGGMFTCPFRECLLNSRPIEGVKP